MSQILDNGRDLPCDGRKPLPPPIAFKRVEGGAPYMYEPTHGTPQYPPNMDWDSQLTYPLEGSYTPMPVPCLPSSLPLSSPSSPSPPPRPPPSPPPSLLRLGQLTQILEWEEVESESEDGEEECLRMKELEHEQNSSAPSLDPAFANVGVSVTNRQNLSQLLVRLGGVPVT